MSKLKKSNSLVEILARRRKPKLTKPRKYTVLLLLPDYVASNFGQETYLAHVKAASDAGAILAARKVAHKAIPVDDLDDFFVLAVFVGFHNDTNTGVENE